jgi:hypothetical protein
MGFKDDLKINELNLILTNKKSKMNKTYKKQAFFNGFSKFIIFILMFGNRWLIVQYSG